MVIIFSLPALFFVYAVRNLPVFNIVAVMIFIVGVVKAIYVAQKSFVIITHKIRGSKSGASMIRKFTNRIYLYTLKKKALVFDSAMK